MLDASKPYVAKNMIIKILEAEPETGFLDISVFSEEDQKPISGAKVTIYLYEARGIYSEAAIENEIVSHITDENGKIPVIELPVIHVFGKPEENTDEYHIKVDALGYYTVIVMNIEIFPNTTTAFNIVLTPVTIGENYTEFINIPEKH